MYKKLIIKNFEKKTVKRSKNYNKKWPENLERPNKIFPEHQKLLANS